MISSHDVNTGLSAYNVGLVINSLFARARVTNGPARIQAYACDRLLSLRIMDRSICSGSARNIYRFCCDCSLRQRDERAISVRAIPLQRQLHPISKSSV